ncbi:hypothetical protein LSAT2_017136 [Lamellibrachia satsuma]|nr:hypothetical protein LSAT2_017136 [Lamellibrachia satsuma]
MRRICKHDLNMADESVFYGTWKIVECVSLAGTVEPTGIEGTVFQLDENGDISWKVCDDAESMPFFSCETYEVSLGNPAILKLFATFAGSIIAFRK